MREELPILAPVFCDLLARLLGRPPEAIHAVNPIDLALHAGENFGLVGESGCGKSSLTRAPTLQAGAFNCEIEIEGSPATSRTALSAVMQAGPSPATTGIRT